MTQIQSISHRLPENSVLAGAGDYLIRQEDDSRWAVYRVSDLLLVSSVIAIPLPGGFGIIQKSDYLSNLEPRVCLEVTPTAVTYATREEATRAVLGGNTHGTGITRILDIQSLLPETTDVLKLDAVDGRRGATKDR